MQICTFTYRSLNLFHYFRTKTQEHSVKVTESGQGEGGMQGRYSRSGVTVNRCDGRLGVTNCYDCLRYSLS